MESQEKTPLPPSKPSRIGRIVPVVVTVIVTILAVLFWQHLSKKKEPAAPPAPPPVPVSIVTVAKEAVPIYPRYLGQTEGSELVNVRARVAGYLTERTFKEGEHVKKGQKLFQIDSRPFEADLNIAKAKLVSAQATLAQAQSQLKRYDDLVAKGSATAGEYEDIQKEERVAEASVAEQKANVDSSALQLEYTAITSPIDGVIGQALKDVGNYVDTGQEGEVAVIQQVDPIYVKFSITEQEILRYQRQISDKQLDSPPLDKLRFKLTLSDGTIYPQIAALNYSDVTIDNATGSGVVRGTVPNPDNKLKPGMFVYATVLDQKLLGVLRVPQAAVLQSPAGANIFVMGDKDLVEIRPVVLGEWSEGDKWIITKGLKEGDRVITDRLPLLRPGAPVIVAPTSQPAATPDSDSPNSTPPDSKSSS